MCFVCVARGLMDSATWCCLCVVVVVPCVVCSLLCVSASTCDTCSSCGTVSCCIDVCCLDDGDPARCTVACVFDLELSTCSATDNYTCAALASNTTRYILSPVNECALSLFFCTVPLAIVFWLSMGGCFMSNMFSIHFVNGMEHHEAGQMECPHAPLLLCFNLCIGGLVICTFALFARASCQASTVYLSVVIAVGVMGSLYIVTDNCFHICGKTCARCRCGKSRTPPARDEPPHVQESDSDDELEDYATL